MTTDISPLRELAIHAENRFAIRNIPLLERSVGRVILFPLPETFAAHRAEFASEIDIEKGVPSTFDCLAVKALVHSFKTAEELGSKKMPGDPTAMTRQVGDVYDRYTEFTHNPNGSKNLTMTVLDDKSLESLLEMSKQFQGTPEMVMAIASEHYAQQMKKQSSLPIAS